MNTWRQMGLDSLLAAKQLLDAARYRSAVSRAYYAAYAAATAELAGIKAVTFPNANNPRHAALPRLLADHLPPPRFDERLRRDLKREMENLRKAREHADYVPTVSVGKQEATRAVKSASRVFQAFDPNGHH